MPAATLPTLATPEQILNDWFSPPLNQHWFASTPTIDAYLKHHYESTWQAAARHQLDHWCDSPKGCLALVIVLDQLPLNIYRGQAISFSTEAQARAVANTAIARGFDRQLDKTQLPFLYLPFMHSESLADQERSVQLFFDADLTDNLPFAQHHYSIVERFGRFPHRNHILGRHSTPAEQQWLNSPEGFKGGLFEDQLP